MRLKESLNKVANYSKEGEYPRFEYTFTLQPNVNLEISCQILHHESGYTTINFNTKGDNNLTDDPKSNFIIFSTLTQIVQNHLKEYDVEKIKCGSPVQKKLDIYEKLFKRFGDGWSVHRDEYKIFVQRKR